MVTSGARNDNRDPRSVLSVRATWAVLALALGAGCAPADRTGDGGGPEATPASVSAEIPPPPQVEPPAPAVPAAEAFEGPVDGVRTVDGSLREEVLERRRESRSELPEPGQNDLYDVGNDVYAMLQKSNESLAGFPLDIRGRVDWMRALDDGLIEPRANMQGTARMEILESDVLMTNTRAMPHVLFPHRSHTRWLACSNCHDAIFVPKRGANRIDMDSIFRGEYCGVCHDRVAFSTYACERCHSVPHEGSPARWW